LAVDVEGGRLPEEADEIVTLVPETQLTRRSWRCKLCSCPAKKAPAKTTGQKAAPPRKGFKKDKLRSAQSIMFALRMIHSDTSFFRRLSKG
jgi:hypothetical protein